MISPDDYDLTFWDFLLLNKRQLVAKGIPKDLVTPMRLSLTGHQNVLSTGWARAIGSWGRVATVEEIARATGKTIEQARSYASAKDLAFKTKYRERTQAELAAGLYFDRSRNPEESRQRWRVLPVERVLYLAWFQEVLDRHAATPKQALQWDLHTLDDAWNAVGAKVEPPRHLVLRPEPEPQPEPDLPGYLRQATGYVR